MGLRLFALPAPQITQCHTGQPGRDSRTHSLAHSIEYIGRMLWKTISDGASRRVRLVDGLAFKTLYLFKYSDLIFWWDKAGRPKSIRWLLKDWWWDLFHTGCKHNEQEVRRWQELGGQEIKGVRLCPVRFYLPWGLLVVMTRADPLGRSVSLEEDNAARWLIGMSRDTGRPDTFGFINGKLVVVDYGW
jgi:hypothetical protein